MSDVKIDDFLNYLKEWRSSKEIRGFFNLSNSEFYHLIKWCTKGKYIEKYSGSGVEPGKTNRSYLYKAI